MNDQSIARRYAKALFELSVEADALDAVAGDLDLAREALEQTPEFFAQLTSPVVDREQKLALVEKFLATARFGETVANALRLLTERHRLALLPHIAAIFGELLDAHRGRIHSKVVSARPLEAHDLDEISRRLGAALHRQVVMDAAVDPDLLGGLTVEVGGQTIDGSVRGQLNALSRALRSA